MYACQSQTLQKILNNRNSDLKRHRFVQFAALQTAGTVHVRVISIDKAAFCAAKHAVLGMRRAEPAAAHFGINPQAAERAEQAGHIKDDEPGGGHVTALRLVARRARYTS
jgi:hypothetical protein